MVSRICCNLFLKLFMLNTSTTCWSRWFQRSAILLEKYFIISLLLFTLTNFALSSSAFASHSPVTYPLIISKTSTKSGHENLRMNFVRRFFLVTHSWTWCYCVPLYGLYYVYFIVSTAAVVTFVLCWTPTEWLLDVYISVAACLF